MRTLRTARSATNEVTSLRSRRCKKCRVAAFLSTWFGDQESYSKFSHSLVCLGTHGFVLRRRYPCFVLRRRYPSTSCERKIMLIDQKTFFKPLSSKLHRA